MPIPAVSDCWTRPDIDDDTTAASLVQELNELLRTLALPLALYSPTDLTPSLLLALLESLLETRLPIAQEVRASRDAASKVEAMKVFLGVLAGDVLPTYGDPGMRVALDVSEVDPRALARGEWDEVVFVGEVLCWVAHRRRMLPDEVEDASDGQAEESERGNDTSVDSSPSALNLEPAASVQTSTMDTRTRCIHQLPDLSLAAEESHLAFDPTDASFGPAAQPAASTADSSFCDCCAAADTTHAHSAPAPASSPSPPRVRYGGWIGRADEDAELRAFERSARRRRVASPGTSRHPADPVTPRVPLSSEPVAMAGMVTKHTSPAQHRLALLTERARLLSEIADLTALR